MEIKNLRSFVAVHEANSFVRAAEMLGTTQSTVSMRIHKLEQEVGGPLFQRLHRAIAPTRKGDKLYRHARRVLAQLDEADAAMKDDEAA